MGLLDGKVVLVTGAGGGIGRCHALACAAEGAAVVVNDLGGSRDGTGEGTAMADQVVAEIVEGGGDAVANYDSVTDLEGCERMVAAAIERWGRLDAVVNNAGILRDKTFAKMSRAEWDLVLSVHLAGTRNVTRAALDALKAGGGSIINTTSYSGMIGNFGQSNYAAAKAGIYGFTRVLAMELRKYSVTANCLAPVAKTRMTDDIAMVDQEWSPAQISPIVVFLASDLARGVTGQVFGVQGQRIHLYEVKTNPGVEKEGDALWTAQEIADRLADITAWEAPAAASDDEEDRVTKVFSHFPAGFKAGAAGDWSATIHWVVAGGTDQTVTVAGDVVEVGPGLSGTPTCTVKTDMETLLAIFSGELDATKAFMTGKASADNMGDLMKMGMAFDFAKVAAAYAADAGGADEVDVVTTVFAKIPEGFKPEAAPGWAAVIQWQVDGGTDQTITVADDACRAEPGLVGTPTCTVRLSKDTLVAMFRGQIDPGKAFMTGKATSDNMGDLMKLGMAFDFKRVAAAVEAEMGPAAAPPAEAAPEVEEGERTYPIGKRYDGGFWFVDRREFQAYAEATDDENEAYYGEDAVAPPMYHVKPFIQLMKKLATDPDLELDLLRLVHGEHDVRFHRPLRHGDVLQLRGTLADVQHKSSGRVVKYGLYGFVDGDLAIEGHTSYFIRGKRKPGAKKAPRPAPAEVPDPTSSIGQPVAADQAIRYAAVSGDDNPLHTDEATAKAAGLPGCILHGLCTMAFAQRDIIRHVAGGDPSRLARLGVRFAKPVFPGETLALQVWDKGNGELDFVTVNGGGQVVISNGRAEVRSA